MAVAIAAAVGVSAGGCSSKEDADGGGGVAVPDPDNPPPVFSLAWSEYPSWSAFGVAAEEGLLDGAEGKLGEMEQKWNVDVVLKQADYDPCLGLYAGGQVDAVCITNIDILPLCEGRPAAVAFPTSTSVGGDAVLAVGVDDVAGLKNVDTRGLDKTVSEYVFRRCLEERGEDPGAYPYKAMDPAAAGIALQNGEVESICVWNPFLLSAEANTPDAKRLMDSSEILEEVIDLVAVGQDSLKKPGGDRFAACLADTFHTFCADLNGPERDRLLVDLAEKFARGVTAEQMEKVTTETRFYQTADAAKTLIADPKFREETMMKVSAFTSGHLGKAAPGFGFADEGGGDLLFTTEYLDLEAAGPGGGAGE